jgi:hypothetical protein
MALKASGPLKPKRTAPVYSSTGGTVDEDYELMPHKELASLRDQLRKLKSMPVEAGMHTGASFEELTKRMDRLIEIFTEAEHQLKLEEGAVSFKEKMAPFSARLDKVLEQNSEIAEGVVALADILTEIKEKLEVGVIYRPEKGEKREEPEQIRAPPRQMPSPPGGMPPMPGGMPPMPEDMSFPEGMPPPPGPMPGAYPLPPKKKGLFGK